jgi:hypothetical protein
MRTRTKGSLFSRSRGVRCNIRSKTDELGAVADCEEELSF